MNRYRHITLFLGVLALFSSGLKAQSEPANSSELELLQVPEMSKEELLDKQKNLARWHMGATLYDASENYLDPVTWQEADSTATMGSLMTDDPTASFEVATGEYRFVIDLTDFYTITRFNFKNFTAAGKLEIFYSRSLSPPDASDWKSLSPAVNFGPDQVLSPKFTPVDTRYLMAHLVITQPGVIGNMGAFGNLSVAEVRMKEQDRDEDIAANTARATDSKPVKVNYASAHTDSRVTYVSSGSADTAISMIDDDVESFYDFELGEEESIIIVDLKEQREVNSVSMLFQSGPGDFDFYIVNTLPEDVKQVIDQMEGEKKAQSASKKGDDDMAMIYNRGKWEPLMLAQAGDDPLGSIMGFAGDAIFTTISLPGDFFNELSPTVEQNVDGNEERFRIDFSNLTGQYLIVRFMPAPGGGSFLRIYEISLMGDYYNTDEAPVERIEAFLLMNGLSPNVNQPTQSLAPTNGPPQVIIVPPTPPPVSPR